MQIILLVTLLTGLVLCGNVFAVPKKLAACDTKGFSTLSDSIKDLSLKGYTNVSYLRNKKNALLGYYAWKDNFEMYSEICDYVSNNDLTTSSEWYYWDSSKIKSDPKTWKTGAALSLSQDEGIVKIKVIKASRKGNVSVEFKVLGWDDNSAEKVVRKDIVYFVEK